MNRGFAFLNRQVVPALVCFGVAALAMRTPLFRHVEALTQDERTKLRLEGTVGSDALALLSIDSTSLNEIGRWPWPRSVHADLLTVLSRARPAVVAWDIFFPEPSEHDDALARAARTNRAVVFGAEQGDETEGAVTPAAAVAAGARLQALSRVEGDRGAIPASPGVLVPAGRLAQAANIGFVDTTVDDDGVLRHAPLLLRVGDQVFPSLALQGLMDYWGAEPGDVTVRLGDAIILDAPLAKRRIPIDAAGRYTVNYRHTREGFVEYGYSSAWNDLTKRFADRKPVRVPALTGRIVLVGQVADGLTDFGPTPMSPHTPLVLVHANVIENVLLEDYARPVRSAYVWAGGLLLGVVGLARFSHRRPHEQALFAFGVPVAYAIAATCAWINGSWIVPLVGPVLGFVLLQGFMIGRRMIAEMRSKEQIKGMFGTYVSPELVERLVAADQPPRLGGHQAEITAYFSDIQEFSTFSEILPPPRLVELMNEYLTACTDIIQAQGGTLDKYIGDAVVAMFGAPVELPDHAARACITVALVQQRMDELRAKWQGDGEWPDLVARMRTRIGLNTGACVIGNIGSRTRFNYTMMGDNVNLAARMESGAKTWGAYAMCTAATRDACERHAPGEVVFRPLGRIRVKGRSASVPIFEIAGRRGGGDPALCDCIGAFDAALQRYYERDWDGAEREFRRSAALEPLQPGKSPGVSTNPSLVYLELVGRFRDDPPPADWDGVFAMKEK